MKRRWGLWLCILALMPLGAASAQSSTGVWSAPSSVAASWVVYPSTNASATQVVFLNPYSPTPGATDWFYDHQVLYTEYSGGAWSTPVVVGSNAMYRITGWVPVATHPVISADGNTIAYLGCTGNCKPISQGDAYDIYVVRRGVSGWGQPAVLPTGAVTIDSQIGLSADGKTVAYRTDYLNFPFYAWNRVYAVTRTGESWGAPVAVSNDGVNAFFPTLSQDGKQVMWRSNPPSGSVDVLYYASQLPAGGWSAPQILNSNLNLAISIADYHCFSPDGNSIFYWNVNPADSNPNNITLYVLHRAGSAWGSPQPVTPGVYAYDNDGLMAGLNFDGSRVVYPDPLLHNEYLDDISLEMVEYKNGAWSAPTAITVHKEGTQYFSPLMSQDGKRLIAQGPSKAYDGDGVVLFTYSQKFFTYIPMTKK